MIDEADYLEPNCMLAVPNRKLPTFMWHGAASFEKHERVLRRGDIGTAAGEFIGECEHVIYGIIAG